MPRSLVFATILIASCAPSGWADLFTIDFEGHGDLNPITTEYTSLTFSNAATIVSGAAGGSLNESEFPPHSGITVAFNTADPMSIVFAVPIASFDGYFNYSTALDLRAFDGSNNLVDGRASAFNSNLGLTGDIGSTPNELLSLSFAKGISRIEISGAEPFTLDDVTVTVNSPDTSSVPEGSSAGLLATVVGLLLLVKIGRRSGRPSSGAFQWSCRRS